MENRLELIIGPMFAGKTSALLSKIETLSRIESINLVYVNSKVDTRGSADTFSCLYSCHSAKIYDSDFFKKKNVFGFKTEKLSFLTGVMTSGGKTFGKMFLNSRTIIFIDECQFFPDLKDFVVSILELEDGPSLVVAGLYADAKNEMFGECLQLIPYADKTTILHGHCELCARKGIIRDSLHSFLKESYDSDQIMVGGANKYMALCRNCYNSMNKG